MRNTAILNDSFAALRAELIAERNKLEFANPTKLQVLAAPQNVAIEDQISLLHEQFVALSQHSGHLLAEPLHAGVQIYGTCEDCEGEISMKRLKAVPWALRCIPCQERIERDSPSRAANVALAAFG